MANDNGSIYDFVDSEFKAPEVESKRAVGWQANRADNTKPYVNTSKQAIEATRIEQKDYSYYEFDNMIFRRNPRDAFGAKVNKEFGVLTEKFDFKQEKQRYIELYRELME